MTMFRFINKRKWLLIFPLVMVMTLGAYSSIEVEISCAHTPQHVIDALEITPSYQQDQTVFIIVQNKLLKSTNGGLSWKELVHGLDNTFVLSSIAISPEFEADQTVFASADGDGVYKSVDAGVSWAKINQGLANLGIGMVAISPAYAQDALILAAGAQGGLYKTVDGGQNWSEVLDQGVKVTAIAFSPDADRELIVLGDDRGQLWSSEDKASSWQRIYQLPNSGGVTTIVISDHFAVDGIFFAGTQQQGVFKTVDGGQRFVRLENGPSTLSVRREGRRHLIIRPADQHITALALSPDYARNERVFGATWYDAVFESDDGGQRWTKQTLGISCDGQADETGYNVPHFRHLKISKRFQEDGTLFLAGFDGLFKSTDGGRAWTQLETLPVSLIRGIGLSPARETGQFSLALTTYGGGAYTTADQGITWAIHNQGLKTTRLSDIAFSPTYQADNTLYSASQSNFLRSADGAEHWKRLGLDYNGWRKQLSSKLRRFGVPSAVSNQLLLDEHEQDSNWPMVIVFSPNFASDRTLYFGTRRHGIFKSVDGGLSWPEQGRGPNDWITALVISPDFATDQTLFAGIRERGVYKTGDGGETWQPVNNGFEFLKEVALPVSPNYNVDPVLFASLKDIRLAISPAFGQDRTVFASSNEGLFKTMDGGQTWHKLASAPELEHSNIESLAISPAYENDHMLLVSVKGKGLFKTGDGGDTFVEIGEQLIEQNQTLKWLAFSPLYPADKTIYAASEETLFRSVDGGQSWHSMPRPVRYENWRGEGHGPVKFDGPWRRSGGGAEVSASSISVSDTAQATATLYFTGTGVSWIGTEGPDQGLARVYIDGQSMAEVDQYGQSSNTLVTSFAITDLADGAHSITVEVTGAKNPASTGQRITIDAFDITPAG